MNARFVILGLIASASCHVATPAPVAGPARDIAILASREFGGRLPGTPGGDSAAAFIVRRYTELNLRPAFGASYLQAFPFEKDVAQNVGAIIGGTDSTVRGQYILIGAHFDHLGQSAARSFDPEYRYALRPGADDNASGTAGVLELARRFAQRPIRRSIMVVNFDAEEAGLCGSRAFVDDLPISQSAIMLMLNLDMIGRMSGNRVFVEGNLAPSVSPMWIARTAAAAGLSVKFSRDRGMSDHSTFLAHKIDVVSLSTGESPDYHRRTDVASRINVRGLERVIDLAEAIVRERDAR
jgi:Zn-dependent M28 family amino/carboxypeptidase